MKKPVNKPKNKGEGVMLRSKRGFTIVELLVVISIILILAAFVSPVVSRARAKASSAACINNVRQGALAQLMYAQDNMNTTAGAWANLIPDYADATIQNCPTSAAAYTLFAVNLDPGTNISISGAAGNHPTFPAYYSEGSTGGKANWRN